MPRLVRFKRYKEALRVLQALPGAAGTPLYEYTQYAAGNNKITRATPVGVTGKQQTLIKLFGRDATSTVLNRVNVSNRSVAAIASALGSTDTVLGWVATLPATSTVSNDDVDPATAVIKVIEGTTVSTPKISAITKVSYKRKVGPSYTYPFGQGTAADRDREFEAQEAIRAAIPSNNRVTFKPERLYAVR